jgi:uncharacterized protein
MAPAAVIPERRLRDSLASLEGLLRDMGSVVIAYSGGVDSTFLLRVACSVPELRCVALTTDSPTNTAEEVDEARTLARSFGARHLVVAVDELATPGYAANPPDRCYLCKQTLYPLCFDLASKEAIRWVADGVNLDDLGDYRPGLRAAEEMGVRHPLVEAGMTKADVRALSASLGLETADKPASPCLSSRFPYGTQITHDDLRRVERAEAAVRALGFRELRVRFHGQSARVEVAASELDRLADPALRRAVAAGVSAAGFHEVEIANQPLRSGSLNDALRRGELSVPENAERSRNPRGE